MVTKTKRWSRKSSLHAAAFTTLTPEEMPAAHAAAERARLPKRRDLSIAAIMERVGDSTTNPDAEYAVRLTRALFM